MNSLKLLEAESKAETKASEYERIYSERHGVPEEWVRLNPRLQLAAFLEWQCGMGIITVPHARRLYCKEYPEANRLAVPKTVYEGEGYYYQDKKYALGSVLSLIKPYDDSIREVRNILTS